jgi:8-amino-7-oxononanoate synthase
LEKLTSHSIWDRANDAGILRLPLYEEEDWNSLPFVTQILPVWTRPRHNYFLAFHLQLAGFSAFPISFPVVPKNANRVRLSFHAANSDDEVEALAASICTWAEEMLSIDEGGDRLRLPTAARQVYALMSKN